MMNRRFIGNVLSTAFSYCVAILIIIPIFSMFNIALKSQAESITNLLGIVRSPQFGNFIEAFKQAEMGRLFLNSIIITVVSATGNSFLALLIAFPISRKLTRLHKVLYRVFALGIFLPPGIVPLYALMANLGLARSYWGFIVMASGMHLTISVFILVGFIKNIPTTLDEAAFVEGCSYLRYVFEFAVPLLKTALTTVWMLRALNIWNDFLYPFVFLKASQRTLPTGLYAFRGQYLTNWPLLMAGSVLVSLPIIILYAFLQQRMTNGIVAGAVKG